MADSLSTSAGSSNVLDEDVSQIIEQRKASLRYFNANYYAEWVEIYMSAKARVKPVYVVMENGEKKEDPNRTNVALPDHFVMIRNGVARLTRNPPNLRMRSENKDAADKMGAELMYQWDRGEAQKAFKKVTQSAKALGWGVGKSYYDNVKVMRHFRRWTHMLKRSELMQHEGAPEDEIDDSVEEYGEELSQDEKASAIADHGEQVQLDAEIVKYSGCKLDSIFVGDFYPEPGFRTLNESAFNIENSLQDEDWLEYWTEQTTINPETGKEQPVIDPKMADEVLRICGDRNYIDTKEISLRRQFREAINIADPKTSGTSVKAPKKRFMLDEHHAIIDGKLVITYVGEESIKLGTNWYPYDTYGRSLYTDMVLIPDMLGGIGDSTPRISRFLMQLRNQRVNQTTDFINNKLAPIVKALEGHNFTEKSLQRTSFMRLLNVRNMGELEPLQDATFPGEAWEDQAQFVREMQQIEPSTNNFASGTDTVPQAGKLATTAVLAQKSSDNVLADELNQINVFIAEVGELWVHINQQAMEKPHTVNPGDVPRFDAMSLRTDGAQPRSITIDPMDIQEEFQVIPEAGSTLADDDEFKTQALQQLFQLAAAHPDVFNKRNIGQKLLQTMPGISVEEGMAPPPAGPPPPPPPKVSLNVAVKFETLAADVQSAILSEIGLPTHGTEVMGAITHATDAVQKISDAADAATNLQSAAEPPQTAVPPAVKSVMTKADANGP